MYYFSGSEILCARCLEKDVPESELAAYLDSYIGDLPDDIRVDADTYMYRLRQCAACPHLIKFTCVKCGCYAQVRAARKHNGCPLAGGERWLPVD